MMSVVTFLLVSLFAYLTPVKGGSTSKRGAAYNDIATVPLLHRSGTISWAYNWAMSELNELPFGVEFVPMLWGAEFDHWIELTESSLANGSTYLLGFNEPDISSQENMSPSVAATYYRNHITSFQDRAKLVSPAVTSSISTGMGLDWLDKFMEFCFDCSISVAAVHWYGDSADAFKSFIHNATTFARSHDLAEVWITEFALNADTSGVVNQETTEAFIESITSWLDSQSMVTRYSYFMCAEGYLLSHGALNAAGQAYASSCG
ncbi:unnamed protein product [Penicillium salamii]|nr:unnamed protein product [Penicillium salamii]